MSGHHSHGCRMAGMRTFVSVGKVKESFFVDTLALDLPTASQRSLDESAAANIGSKTHSH